MSVLKNMGGKKIWIITHKNTKCLLLFYKAPNSRLQIQGHMTRSMWENYYNNTFPGLRDKNFYQKY